MNVDTLIESLHPLERKVLPVLDKLSSVKEITKTTGLQEVEVMRALQWLQNKDIITLNEELKELNTQARDFAKKISENFKKLGI